MRLPSSPPLRVAALAMIACGALAGCGKTLSSKAGGEGSMPAATVDAQGAVGLSTKNTTRLGGSTSATDAAAVAVAVYPGLTAASRPRAVALVEEGEWPAALAGSVLAGAPLRTPLLYSGAHALPDASTTALRTLKPTGARALGGVQVIRIGAGGAPSGYVTRSITGANSAALAVAIERVWSALSRRSPRQIIVTAAGAPPALTMPAAGLSAQTGAPILFVERTSIPEATARELVRLGHTSMYLVGPSTVVDESTARKLGRYGAVTRIAGATPASNAIAVARFTDGSFGWGVVEPGHGLVFANSSRPLDGPAAAPLSASGDYGPLLLLEDPMNLPSALSGFLSDLQPGTPASGAVHGVYNHGWLIGPENAISAMTQARLDSILEISSRVATEPAVTTPSTPPSEPEQGTG